MSKKIISKTTDIGKKMYDKQCKVLLTQPHILARILKTLVEETNEFTEKELASILKSIFIDYEKELWIWDEKPIRCDIFFHLDLPNKERLYIDIEIQSEDNPRIRNIYSWNGIYRSNSIGTNW